MSSRKWVYLAAVILAAAALWRLGADHGDGARAAQRAFERRVSGVTLTVPGRVERTVDDDTRPPRHQRFIIRTTRGQTLLVAHNLELAPRVPLKAGDRVTVRGEYEWNAEGGVLHNTHRAPRGGSSGWIRLEPTERLYR
jgi:hypothetical protein